MPGQSTTETTVVDPLAVPEGVPGSVDPISVTPSVLGPVENMPSSDSFETEQDFNGLSQHELERQLQMVDAEIRSGKGFPAASSPSEGSVRVPTLTESLNFLPGGSFVKPFAETMIASDAALAGSAVGMALAGPPGGLAGLLIGGSSGAISTELLFRGADEIAALITDGTYSEARPLTSKVISDTLFKGAADGVFNKVFMVGFAKAAKSLPAFADDVLDFFDVRRLRKIAKQPAKAERITGKIDPEDEKLFEALQPSLKEFDKANSFLGELRDKFGFLDDVSSIKEFLGKIQSSEFLGKFSNEFNSLKGVFQSTFKQGELGKKIRDTIKTAARQEKGLTVAARDVLKQKGASLEPEVVDELKKQAVGGISVKDARNTVFREVNGLLEKIKVVQDAGSETINKTIPQLSKGNGFLSSIAKQSRKIFDKFFNDLAEANPGLKSLVKSKTSLKRRILDASEKKAPKKEILRLKNKLQIVEEDIENFAIPIDALHTAKVGFGGLASKALEQEGSSRNPATADIYNSFREGFKTLVDRRVTEIFPESEITRKTFFESNRLFELLKFVEPMVKRAARSSTLAVEKEFPIIGSVNQRNIPFAVNKFIAKLLQPTGEAEALFKQSQIANSLRTGKEFPAGLKSTDTGLFADKATGLMRSGLVKSLSVPAGKASVFIAENKAVRTAVVSKSTDSFSRSIEDFFKDPDKASSLIVQKILGTLTPEQQQQISEEELQAEAEKLLGPVKEAETRFGQDSVEAQTEFSKVLDKLGANVNKSKSGIAGEIKIKGKIFIPDPGSQVSFLRKLALDSSLDPLPKAKKRQAMINRGEVLPSVKTTKPPSVKGAPQPILEADL